MGDKYCTHHKRKKPKLTKEQIKERNIRKNKMKGKIIKSKSGGN